MKTSNSLGIYIGPRKAVGVYVGSKGHGHHVIDRFIVDVDAGCPEPFKELASRIAQACSQRKIRFSDVAVAIDCTLYVQHKVHSEFSNIKQIAATVRYDTEEVLATDISDMALCFQIIRSTNGGSELNVFAARRQVLEPLILALQSHNIDPVLVEPDAISLARFIHSARAGQKDTRRTLAILASCDNCYFLSLDTNNRVLPVRAFPIGSCHDRVGLIGNQAFTTLAVLDQPATVLALHDSAGQLDSGSLSKRLGLEVVDIGWFGHVAGGQDQIDPICQAIAFGATLTKEDRVHTPDFRADFMPYQGKRLRLHKAARWASISLTILIIAAGASLQAKYMQLRHDCVRLRDRVIKDYTAVMPGRTLQPGRNPVEELKREVRRIKDIRSGELSLQESVLARLTLLLRSFNSYGKAGLQIDSIDITTNTVRLDGSLPNRLEAQTFFNLLRSNQWEIQKETLDDTAGRCSFSVVLAPARSSSKETKG